MGGQTKILDVLKSRRLEAINLYYFQHLVTSQKTVMLDNSANFGSIYMMIRIWIMMEGTNIQTSHIEYGGAYLLRNIFSEFQ